MEKKDIAFQPVGVESVQVATAPTAIVVQPTGENVGAYPTFVDFSKFKPIPADFTRVDPLCCAFGCSKCDPECWGFKALVKCGCIEYEANQCRPVSNDTKACCLLSLVSLEIVDCVNEFKCYSQSLCWECVCGCPLDESFVDTPAVTLTNYGSIDYNDLYPYSTACCCCCCGSIDSVYLKWPQCVGIYTNSECCCSYTSNACLKPMCLDDTNPKKNLQFLCARNRWLLVNPRVCCKDQSQAFIFDHRCACPYDDDVFCAYMFPLTFFTCCVHYRWAGRCCMSYAEMLQFYRETLQRPVNSQV